MKKANSFEELYELAHNAAYKNLQIHKVTEGEELKKVTEKDFDKKYAFSAEKKERINQKLKERYQQEMSPAINKHKMH